MNWEPPAYRVRAIQKAIEDKAGRILPGTKLPQTAIVEFAIAAIKADHEALMKGGPMLGARHAD